MKKNELKLQKVCPLCKEVQNELVVSGVDALMVTLQVGIEAIKEQVVAATDDQLCPKCLAIAKLKEDELLFIETEDDTLRINPVHTGLVRVLKKEDLHFALIEMNKETVLEHEKEMTEEQIIAEISSWADKVVDSTYMFGQKRLTESMYKYMGLSNPINTLLKSI